MDIKRPQTSFGTVYYPEEWDEEHWEQDATLMQKLGLGLVRMGDAAWAKMETAEGQYDFSWLDKAIEVFSNHRIKTIVCVPLFNIPSWLAEKCGTSEPCFSNKEYISHCVSFARTLSEHFGSNIFVSGYQVFERIGSTVKRMKTCKCKECEDAFHLWLENRYSKVEKMNLSWGAAASCKSFSQVRFPDGDYHQPAQVFDFKKFRSDSFAALMKKVVSAMRPATKAQCITAEFSRYPEDIDYAAAAACLDFTSCCNFPDKGRPEGSVIHEKVVQTAARLEYLRGLKGGTHWIMEQQCGSSGWGNICREPAPGRIRLWTAQAVAHGADAVFFAAWRPRVSSSEDYSEGILPIYGDTSRRYEEIQRTLMVLKPALNDVRENVAEAHCKIIYSAEQKWALDKEKGHEDFSYTSCVTEYYQAFFERNIPVDIISPDDDFRYSKLVVAPYLYMLDRGLQAKLDTFVMSGGTLIVSTRSGIKNGDYSTRHDSPLPCGLHNMCGVLVSETDCLRDGPMMLQWSAPLPSVKYIAAPSSGNLRKVEQLSMPSVSQMYGRYWADVIKTAEGNTEGTKVLATYAGDGFYKGEPAITVHKHGAGTVYYVGTQLSPALIRLLIAHATQTAEIPRSFKTPMGVEVIRRSGKENDWLFIINHTHSQVKLENPPIALGAMGVRYMAVAKPRKAAVKIDDTSEKSED